MRAAETRARADEMKEAEPKAIIRLAEWRPQRQTNIALFRKPLRPDTIMRGRLTPTGAPQDCRTDQNTDP